MKTLNIRSLFDLLFAGSKQKQTDSVKGKFNFQQVLAFIGLKKNSAGSGSKNADPLLQSDMKDWKPAPGKVKSNMRENGVFSVLNSTGSLKSVFPLKQSGNEIPTRINEPKHGSEKKIDPEVQIAAPGAAPKIRAGRIEKAETPAVGESSDNAGQRIDKRAGVSESISSVRRPGAMDALGRTQETAEQGAQKSHLPVAGKTAETAAEPSSAVTSESSKTGSNNVNLSGNRQAESKNEHKGIFTDRAVNRAPLTPNKRFAVSSDITTEHSAKTRAGISNKTETVRTPDPENSVKNNTMTKEAAGKASPGQTTVTEAFTAVNKNQAGPASNPNEKVKSNPAVLSAKKDVPEPLRDMRPAEQILQDTKQKISAASLKRSDERIHHIYEQEPVQKNSFFNRILGRAAGQTPDSVKVSAVGLSPNAAKIESLKAPGKTAAPIPKDIPIKSQLEKPAEQAEKIKSENAPVRQADRISLSDPRISDMNKTSAENENKVPVRNVNDQKPTAPAPTQNDPFKENTFVHFVKRLFGKDQTDKKIPEKIAQDQKISDGNPKSGETSRIAQVQESKIDRASNHIRYAENQGRNSAKPVGNETSDPGNQGQKFNAPRDNALKIFQQEQKPTGDATLSEERAFFPTALRSAHSASSGQKSASHTPVVHKIVNSIMLTHFGKGSETTFKIDSGYLGKIDISFKETKQHKEVTMLVENEAAKYEMEKLLPRISEALLQKGIELQQIKIDINNSNRNEQQANHTGNSKTTQSHTPGQEVEDEKNSAPVKVKNYGYNTMEIVA